MIRMILVSVSAGAGKPEAFENIERWLVIIPSRDEGVHLETTLRSLPADGGQRVKCILLLDGPDAEVRRDQRGRGGDHRAVEDLHEERARDQQREPRPQPRRPVGSGRSPRGHPGSIARASGAPLVGGNRVRLLNLRTHAAR